MTSNDFEERFSRQIKLPKVGLEGQKKWSQSAVLLAGEGIAFQSAATALASTGLGQLYLVSPEPIEISSLIPPTLGLSLSILDTELDELPVSAITIVVSENPGFRRRLSRDLRRSSKPALFGWPSGSGYSLYLTRHIGNHCPCLECFETLNPKAFSTGSDVVKRILGALTACEAFKWTLLDESPLENKVWITSLEKGISFHHVVAPSHKCATAY